MRYVVWGAGFRGKIICEVLGLKKIVAFIDSDNSKVGGIYQGKRVISLQEYKDTFDDCFIIVSPTEYDEIVQTLVEHGIKQYFVLLYEISEFQRYGGVNNAMGLLDLSQYSGKDVYIYGLSVFGLELYEKLLIAGVASVQMIVKEEPLVGQMRFLREKYPEYKVYDGEIEDISDNTDILCTTAHYYMAVENNIIGKKKLINMFDLSDRIKEYYNPKLEIFHDKYKGKRCFIVGCGPSLHAQDLETLYCNNELCFGVNRIYKMCDISWRADFYVILDEAYLKLFKDDICLYDAKYKFIAGLNKDFWTDKMEEMENVFKYHCVRLAQREGRLPGNLFSENIPQKIYVYTSVVYVCIQLAAYMGFSEIYLLGTDCDFVGKKLDHFYEDEKEFNNLMHAHQEQSFQEYGIAKAYADTHGIKIYNATRGGMLEVFERVDFDSLFEQ